MAPQTADELKAMPGCVSPENSVWQPYEFPKLEPETIEKFSMKDLRRSWRRYELPSQIAVHRGLYNNYAGISENSLAAVIAALEAGFSIIEIDIVLTKDDQPILSHDKTTLRNTMIPNEKWSNLSLSEVQDTPLIIRDVKGGTFAETFMVTDQKVTRLEDCLDAALAINPHVTFNLDCRDDTAARMYIWLLNRPHYHQCVILQFYHYAYNSGRVLVEEIFALKPDADIGLIPVIPVVFPELLFDYAIDSRYAYSKEEIALQAGNLYLSGLTWIQSIVNEGFNMFGVSLIISGPGKNYDTMRKQCVDRSGRPVADNALPAYAADCALILLARRLRRLYPTACIVGICRSYDAKVEGRKYKYSFSQGIPVSWPDDQTKDLVEAQAIPGYNNDLLDLTISDRPYDSIATLDAEENGQQIVFDAEYPLNDTRGSGR